MVFLLKLFSIKKKPERGDVLRGCNEFLVA